MLREQIASSLRRLDPLTEQFANSLQELLKQRFSPQGYREIVIEESWPEATRRACYQEMIYILGRHPKIDDLQLTTRSGGILIETMVTDTPGVYLNSYFPLDYSGALDPRQRPIKWGVVRYGDELNAEFKRRLMAGSKHQST